MVGWLDNGCTGVLLTPELVVSGAHCGAASAFWLGDEFEIAVDDRSGVARPINAPEGSEQGIAECHMHPDGALTSGMDIGWCRLSASVLRPEIIVTPLVGCARESLPEKAAARLVGFGSDDGGDTVVSSGPDAPSLSSPAAWVPPQAGSWLGRRLVSPQPVAQSTAGTLRKRSHGSDALTTRTRTLHPAPKRLRSRRAS